MQAASASKTLAQVNRFCGQYLQLEPVLDYPDGECLREEETQDTLYQRIFSDSALSHPPPIRYRLKVLKEIVSRIEASIDDWDKHGVSEDLMSCLSELLPLPLPSEMDAVQQKSYVTYSLSLLSIPEDRSSQGPGITILESRSLISAGGTTGLRTWEAALHLGQYLCVNPEMTRKKRVLELGAGTGYLSILCAKYLDAEQVIASDGSDDVVLNLPENFYINGLQDSPVVSASDLKWGHAIVGTEEEHWNGGVPIDVVLGADITYDKSVIPALVATVGELFDLFPECTVLIAATERNRETYEAFLMQCEHKFKFREIDYRVPPREEQTGPFYSDASPIRICEINRAG